MSLPGSCLTRSAKNKSHLCMSNSHRTSRDKRKSMTIRSPRKNGNMKFLAEWRYQPQISINRLRLSYKTEAKENGSSGEMTNEIRIFFLSYLKKSPWRVVQAPTTRKRFGFTLHSFLALITAHWRKGGRQSTGVKSRRRLLSRHLSWFLLRVLGDRSNLDHIEA